MIIVYVNMFKDSSALHMRDAWMKDDDTNVIERLFADVISLLEHVRLQCGALNHSARLPTFYDRHGCKDTIYFRLTLVSTNFKWINIFTVPM